MAAADTLSLDVLINQAPAVAAIGKLSGSISSLASGLGGVGAMGVAAGNLLAGGIKSAFGFISSKIPIVGESFQIMGDVITRNLLWPLTQYLIPILMEMMNWVAQNRIAFVQIGEVLVGIFKLVWTVGGALVHSLTTAFEHLFSMITNGGKLTLGGFLQFINFILLKIAFAFIFLEILLEPLIAKIGDLLGTIIKNALIPFVEGFVEGFSDIIPLVTELVQSLLDLLPAGNSMKGLGPIFKFIGKMVADFALAPLRLLVWVFKTIPKVIQDIKGDFSEIVSVWQTISNGIDAFIQKIVAFKDAVKSGFFGIVDEMWGKFKALVDYISGIGTTIKNKLYEGFTGAWEDLKNSKAGQFVTKLFADDKPQPAATPTGASNTVSNSSTVNNSPQATVNLTVNGNPDASAVQKAKDLGSTYLNQFKNATAGMGR